MSIARCAVVFALLMVPALAMGSVTSFSVTTSVVDVERGGVLDVILWGETLGGVSMYEAAPGLPTGLIVQNPSSNITIGSWYTTPAAQLSVTRGASPASLVVSMDQVSPYYETHNDLRTLGTFHVSVGASAALGANEITTSSSRYSNNRFRQVDPGTTSFGSTTVNVWAPQLTLSSNSLDFGQVLVGQNKLLTDTITNTGNVVTILNGIMGSLDPSGLTKDGVPYAGTNPFLITISAGVFNLGTTGSSSFTVKFAPTADGEYTCYFDLLSDSGVGGTVPTGNSRRVLLKGTTRTIPEPATLALLACGAVGLLRRKTR